MILQIISAHSILIHQTESQNATCTLQFYSLDVGSPSIF